MKHLNRIWFGMRGVLFLAVIMFTLTAIVYGISSDVLEYQIASYLFVMIVVAYVIGLLFEKEGEDNQETI